MTTTVLITFIVMLLALFSVCGIFCHFAYLAARKNEHATFVRTDTFRIIMKGESVHKVLWNLTDAYYDRDKKTIVPIKGSMKRIRRLFCSNYKNPVLIFLEKVYGIYWVSLWYPLYHILEFEIPNIHRYNQAKAQGDLRSGIEVQSDPKKTLEIYHYINRPFFMEIVLGVDKFVVLVIVMFEGEIVDPVKFAVSLRADPERLDAGIEGGVNDYANPIDYDKISKIPTGKDSELSKYILRTCSAELIRDCGVRPTDVYIKEMRPNQSIMEATQLKGVTQIKADARVIEAKGEAEAMKELTGARTSRLVNAMTALGDKFGSNLDANLVLHEITQAVVAENITSEKSKITAFAQAGSNAALGIGSK